MRFLSCFHVRKFFNAHFVHCSVDLGEHKSCTAFVESSWNRDLSCTWDFFRTGSLLESLSLSHPTVALLSGLELLISTDSTQQLVTCIIPIYTDSRINIADIVTVSSACANGLEASYQLRPWALVDI